MWRNQERERAFAGDARTSRDAKIVRSDGSATRSSGGDESLWRRPTRVRLTAREGSGDQPAHGAGGRRPQAPSQRGPGCPTGLAVLWRPHNGGSVDLATHGHPTDVLTQAAKIRADVSRKTSAGRHPAHLWRVDNHGTLTRLLNHEPACEPKRRGTRAPAPQHVRTQAT